MNSASLTPKPDSSLLCSQPNLTVEGHRPGLCSVGSLNPIGLLNQEQVVLCGTWTWEHMAPRNSSGAMRSSTLKCQSSKIQTQGPWVPGRQLASCYPNRWGQRWNVKPLNLRMTVAIDWAPSIFQALNSRLDGGAQGTHMTRTPSHPTAQVSTLSLREIKPLQPMVSDPKS